MDARLTGLDVNSVSAMSHQPFDLGGCYLALPSSNFPVEIIPGWQCYFEDEIKTKQNGWHIGGAQNRWFCRRSAQRLMSLELSLRSSRSCNTIFV